MKELYLLFEVGGVEYALPAARVLHMESYEGATKVPRAPAFVAGLVQIRGKVTTVIDLGERFGTGATQPALGARVIVVQRAPREIGLLVERAREVVRLSEDQLRDPPEVMMEGARFVSRVAQVGQRLVMLLDLDEVIGSGLEERNHGEHRIG